MPSKRPRRLGQFIGWTVLVGVACLLLMLGAVLDWSTLRLGSARISRTGLESGGGGFAGALGAALLGATTLRLGRRTRRLLGPLAIGIGIACGFVTAVEIVAIAAPVAGEATTTTLGPGVWVAALGALTALVAGIGLVFADRW